MGLPVMSFSFEKIALYVVFSFLLRETVPLASLAFIFPTYIALFRAKF